jgi:ketosteroid isomerase-like protein
MSEANVDLVRRVFMAWQAGAIDRLDELLAPDVEWRPTELSEAGHDVFRGREGIHEWISIVSSRGAEIRNEIAEMRDLGDRVLVLGRVIEKVDERTRVDAELAWLFHVYEGKITRGEGFVSRTEAFRAAGVTDEASGAGAPGG